ncbi:hypothetical protein D3C79_900400 [compost metagenome]
MQRFQHVLAVRHGIAATELSHAQAVAADEKHPIEIVGRDEILFPILDQPAQRIEGTAVSGVKRTVGFRIQRKKLRRTVLAGEYPTEHIQAADRAVKAIFRHIFDIPNNIGRMTDITLRLLEIQAVFLPDVSLFIVQDIQDIEGREQRAQRPQRNRQHPEQIAGYF